MKRLGFVLLAATVAAGCGSADDNARWSAEKAVSASLKDPDSAKFRDVFVVTPTADQNPHFRPVAVCGVVDGKNSFGVHTGGARFVVRQVLGKDDNKVQAIVFVEIETPDRRATLDTRRNGKPETVFERVYWNEQCVDGAHPPSYTGTF